MELPIKDLDGSLRIGQLPMPNGLKLVATRMEKLLEQSQVQ